MTWKPLPDLLGIGLLIYAFVSVAKPGSNLAPRCWLAGWVMIEVHFLMEMLAPTPGLPGLLASGLSISALTWCGLCFVRSTEPRPFGPLSRAWFWSLGAVNTFYLTLQSLPDASRDLRGVAGSLYAVVPLALLATFHGKEPGGPQRWPEVALYCALSLLLVLAAQGELGADGDSVAIDATLSLAFLMSFLRFIATYPRRGGGYVVTAAGMFAWCLVFPVGDQLLQHFPQVHVDDEVWNLPKYLVAVGMILILFEEELRRNQHLAQHDPLTDLPNRRQFLDCLNGAIERARRAGTRLALLSIDLDGFKQVNDRLGHHVGDVVLQRVATLFVGRVRRGDLVARIGGDEFSVVLEGNPTGENARQVADQLSRLLDEPLALDRASVRVGASIGMAIFPDDAQTLEGLCVVADQRMYAVKAAQSAGAASAGAALDTRPSLGPTGA